MNRPYPDAVVAAIILIVACLLPAKGQAPVAPPVSQAAAPRADPVPGSGLSNTGQDGKDGWDRVEIIASIISAVATVAATAFAWLAAIQSQQAARETQQAAERTEQAARAQRLSELWGDMHKLAFVSEEEKAQLNQKAVAEKVRENINAMEKIAFTWDADLVDRAAVERELGLPFVKLYDQINGLGSIKELNRTGAQLVAQNPLTTKLCGKLRAQSKIDPKGSQQP